MKSSLLVKSIIKAYNDRQPVLLLGAPGVGKSGLVYSVKAMLGMIFPGFDIADVRMALYQPVDVKGMPVVDLKEMLAKWTKPDFFRKLKPGTCGIIFLDEITAARPEVQAALYELIYDRRIGEYEIPEGWSIVAAGNRVGDRAVAYQISTALASRFLQLDFDVDSEEWIGWAISNGVHETVISYIRKRPTMLHNFDPQNKARAFACPRTVEKVSNAIKSGLDADIEFDYIAGLTGEAWSTEFVGYKRIMMNMIDPDDVIADPTGVPVQDMNMQYALAISLARLADRSNIAPILIYADRMAPDYGVLLVKVMTDRDANLKKTAAFIKWSAAHKDALI